MKKEELIQEYKSIKHQNFDVLFERLDGSENSEKAFYFLNLKSYSLKYWSKLRLVSLITNLKKYIEYNV